MSREKDILDWLCKDLIESSYNSTPNEFKNNDYSPRITKSLELKCTLTRNKLWKHNGNVHVFSYKDKQDGYTYLVVLSTDLSTCLITTLVCSYISSTYSYMFSTISNNYNYFRLLEDGKSGFTLTINNEVIINYNRNPPIVKGMIGGDNIVSNTYNSICTFESSLYRYNSNEVYEVDYMHRCYLSFIKELNKYIKNNESVNTAITIDSRLYQFKKIIHMPESMTYITVLFNDRLFLICVDVSQVKTYIHHLRELNEEI